MESAGLFVFRMLMEVSYQVLYFIQNELFPTQVRAFAVLLTAVIGNSSTVFIPLTASINESHSFFLPCTFIASAIIITISTTQIKETLGVPPPEIIPEL